MEKNRIYIPSKRGSGILGGVRVIMLYAIKYPEIIR